MTRHGCDQNMVRFGLDWKKSVQCLDLDFEEHEECLGVNGIEDVGKKLSSTSASYCFRGEMVTWKTRNHFVLLITSKWAVVNALA